MGDVIEPELGNLGDQWQQGLNEWHDEGEELGES